MSKNILVAEDDPASAVLLTELLTRWGYEVIVARDGREAIGQWMQRRPDLVLMDLQMPVLDGFATLAEMRGLEAEAHTPTIALTAFAMPDDRLRIAAAGFDGYLTKPVRFEQLRQTIEAALADNPPHA